MKKVIRLTESDLIRLVKRVISEQDTKPEIDVLVVDKEQLEKDIDALAKEVHKIRMQNIQSKKEDIKETLIDVYDRVIQFFEITIRKMKGNINRIKDNTKIKALELKIQNLEKRKKQLTDKRDELEATGYILTGQEKKQLIMSLLNIATMLIPGASVLRTLRGMGGTMPIIP